MEKVQAEQAGKKIKKERHIIHLWLICLCSLLYSPAIYAQVGESLILTHRLDTNTIHSLIRDAKTMEKRYPDSTSGKLREALKLSLNAGYSIGIRDVAYQLMAFYYNHRQFASCIQYAELLMRHCSRLTNKDLICDALLCKGMSWMGLENYDKAMESYQKAMLFAPDKEKKAYVYHNMSVVLFALGQYPKTLLYIDKSFELNGTTYIGLYCKGFIYDAWGDTVRSIRYMDSAYQLAVRMEEKANVLFRKIILLSGKGEAAKAVVLFKQFEPLINSDSLTPEREAQLYLSAGSAYFEMRDFRNMEKYLLKAQQLSDHFSRNDRRLLFFKLSGLYYAEGQYKKAIDFHYLAHKLEDSTKTALVSNKVNELETRFRMTEKDNAIALQKSQIRQSEEARYKDRMWAVALVASLVISLLLLWVRYYYVRQKNQKLHSEREINRLQALMEGEEKERIRLSRELHDGVNSSLAATNSYMQTIEQRYPQMAAEEPFLKVKQLLQSTSSEIRSIAHNLTPNILAKDGLKYALEEFCANLFHQDMNVEVQTFGAIETISGNVALFLYRIAQELLHNIYKHAHAHDIIVVLGMAEGIISLTIEDDGIGIQATQSGKAGIGLDNLKQKVAGIHGTMTIDPGPERGTVVNMVIPWQS